MKKILIILILSTVLAETVKGFPVNPFFFSEKGGKNHTETDRPGSNFILDIIQRKNGSEADTAVFAGTGTGFSFIYNTEKHEKGLKWRNSVPGRGGASSIAADNSGNIWMTTAADTFLVNDNVFLPVGTGVHMTPDSGRTWQYFPQPGVTAIQGLTYDLECDPHGGIWMACFGQSLQYSEDQGQNWVTLTCDKREWDPLRYMNQRMFSVHITESDNLWVGTAEGINLSEDYDVDHDLREWKQFTYSDGLTGNFVTAIGSHYNTEAEKEYVFASTWIAESFAENNGISYTYDNGNTWHNSLADEKVYNFGFNGNDVYACSENGLWKSQDGGKYWEKYQINAWSERKRDFVRVETVYSFEYQNSVMFAGTGFGMAVSYNDGNDWEIIEAYTPSKDSPKSTYAYPNPFSPVKFGEVKLQFKLDRSSTVSCMVYNFAMEKVKTVTETRPFGPGERYLVWDGKDEFGKTVSNGVYFYVIEFSGGEVWNKILIFE